MNKILLLGFEEKDLLGAEIQDLRSKFGTVTFESIYPETRERHAALCEDLSVSCVVMRVEKPYLIPDSVTLRKKVHVRFHYVPFSGRESRLLQHVTGVTFDVHPIPLKNTRLEDAA